MNSVTVGNQTRDDDLRSDNFFAAAHSVMTYLSTGIRRHGRHLVLDGELARIGHKRSADPGQGAANSGIGGHQ